MSRNKGARGELEVVKLLMAHGWRSARRNFASGSQGGGDIAGGPGNTVIEVKRSAARIDVPAAFRQATADCVNGEVPIVMHRRDGEDWLATLPADELLVLLRLRESA